MKKIITIRATLLIAAIILLPRLSIAQGNVGIGTATPDNKLSVSGNVDISGNLGIGTNAPNAKLHVVGALKMVDGTQGAGKVLTSDATGLAKWTNPAEIAAPAAFFFATDQSIGNFSFLGLGTNSSVFIRSSLIVPVNCTLTSIIISVRQMVPNTMISATVWKQSAGSVAPAATPLTVTITDGFATIFATSLGDIPVFRGDLISIQLHWNSGGSLINGATVAVTYK